MRISNTVLLTMGSAMLISSSVAMAAAPTAFGQYTATAGVITPTGTGGCPTGFTCGAAITGDGFLQRQITDGTNTYFQTIILDKQSNVPLSGGLADLSNATFADESFVQQGGGTGIADSNHVYNPSNLAAADKSNFTSNATILVGSQFKGATDNLIDVNQTINDPTTLTNVAFSLQDASTDNTQPVITIDSTVYLTAGGTGTPAATDPRQRFYLKQLKASASGNLADLGAGATVDPTSASVPLAYAANDIIQVLWLGQTVQTDNTDPTVIQPFGLQSFSVNPNGTTTTALTPTAVQQFSSQTAVGSNPTTADPYGSNPFVWDTVFGATQPVF
jgi:hypothetical protein